MVVEVFLDMDEVYVVLGEKLANSCGVCGLIARYIITVDNIWKAGNIESNGVE